MSHDPMQDTTVYKDFCDRMKNQSREQLRIAGDIAKRVSKGSHLSKSSDTINLAASNFCQIEIHLDNIENNLNKVCALTRQFPDKLNPKCPARN